MKLLHRQRNKLNHGRSVGFNSREFDNESKTECEIVVVKKRGMRWRRRYVELEYGVNKCLGLVNGEKELIDSHCYFAKGCDTYDFL